MSDYSDVNEYIARNEAKLEEVFTGLQSFSAFMSKGAETAGGLTIWPAILIYCPRGHKVSDVQLTFHAGAGKWEMNTEPNSQSRAGHLRSRDPRTSGVVSLYRTTFTCEACSAKSRSVVNHPLTGVTLLREYSRAVVSGKASFRLP